MMRSGLHHGSSGQASRELLCVRAGAGQLSGDRSAGLFALVRSLTSPAAASARSTSRSSPWSSSAGWRSRSRQARSTTSSARRSSSGRDRTCPPLPPQSPPRLRCRWQDDPPAHRWRAACPGRDHSRDLLRRGRLPAQRGRLARSIPSRSALPRHRALGPLLAMRRQERHRAAGPGRPLRAAAGSRGVCDLNVARLPNSVNDAEVSAVRPRRARIPSRP